jgi:hypothetical protein
MWFFRVDFESVSLLATTLPFVNQNKGVRAANNQLHFKYRAICLPSPTIALSQVSSFAGAKR